MAAGRSRDEVDEMSWPDVEDIFDYWLEAPPANEILTAVYQVKTKKPENIAQKVVDQNDPSGIGGLIAMFPDGIVPSGR
jgi:hypothetical protein